jgi:hypothetical protein
VSIPIHPNLSEIEVNKIIKMVNKLSPLNYICDFLCCNNFN